MSGQCAICSSPLKREQTTYCSTTCRGAGSAQRRAPNGAEIAQLWAEGHSATRIGAALGLTKNAVIGRARRMRLPPRPSPIELRPWPEERTTQLRALRANGHGYAEIGRRLGLSPQVIRDKCLALELNGPAVKANTLALPVSLRIPLEQRQFAALGRRPPQPAPNVVQLRLPIAPPRACQYPLWGALHADDRPVFARMCDDPRPGLSPRFCGGPAAVGAYCSRHDAIAHRKVAEVAA